MISHFLRIALLASLLPAAATAAQPANAPAIAPTDSWDRYRVLSERNVFLKNRWRPAEFERRYVAPAPTPAETDEQSMVLTGVVQQRDEWVAFVEDSRTGRTTRARAGQTLGAGTVAAITIDGIDYYRGDDHKTIAVGQNLAGLTTTLQTSTPTAAPPAALTTPYSTSAATPPATSSGTPAAPGVTSTQVQPVSGTASGGNEDILERMRRRRAEELKQ